MKGFAWNIALALAWAALTARFTLANLAVGFVVGLGILAFVEKAVGSPRYIVKAWRTVGLTLYFVKELIVANLRVAFDVLTPRHRMQPAVVAVPLDLQSDAEITLLAILITLTPGTLSIDVSADRRVLYLHSMYSPDPEVLTRQVKQGFERRVREIFE